MKAFCLLALFLLLASAPEANIHYFSNVRQVTVQAPGQQNYITIDDEVWNRARRDLGDLRLFAGPNEVPYFIGSEQPERSSVSASAPLLQLGKIAEGTTFFIDASSLEGYNHISLELATRNFVTRARVYAMDDIHATNPTDLGSYTLYDFSGENLGRNFALRIPESHFRYLHVVLGAEVKPEDVKGASILQNAEQPGGYQIVATPPAATQQGKQTVFTWKQSAAVPLERITFETPQINFYREVRLESDAGEPLASGSVSLIHMMRNGRMVDSESLTLDVPSAHAGGYKLIVENGDDPPVPLSIKLWAIERRVYFDPRGNTSLLLYYGDSELSAPEYDYARLFTRDPNAQPATLGAGMHNPDYTGRPDERPWSEKHPTLLWIALILAVLALGGVTISTMKRGMHAN